MSAQAPSAPCSRSRCAIGMSTQLAANAHFMDEKEVKACLECGNMFNSITRRKHHCRICGRIVCWFCSMHTLHDPTNAAAPKVRACNSCYTAAHTTTTAAAAIPSATRAISHSRSNSLTLPASPGEDSQSLSRSHPDHASTLLSPHSLTADELVAGGVPASPLKDSLQPLPMPVFVSSDPVDNTVAAVTAILLDEERKHDGVIDPVHVTATTHLPAATPAQTVSDAMPHTLGDDSPPQFDAAKLSIVVPAKSPRPSGSSSDPSTPAVFVPDVSPVSASEPVSPSHALEQMLKNQPISPLPSSEPVTPTPHTPSPHPHGHQPHSHHLSFSTHTPQHRASLTPVHTQSTPTIPLIVVPPSPTPEVEEKVLLDLPMKLCLVILKKTAADMKQRYSEYLRTKEARHEAQPLSFQQYMFFSTIRTLPDFLFKKTDLAYCMMREEGATVVGRELFVRYAPILPPLASKLDADKVFDALALDFGDVRGVGLNVFKAYVDNLQKEWAPDKHWETWREDYQLTKSEKLLTIRNGVTDTTHFPPHMGTVGLTNSHVLYQSVFKKRRCIHWLDIVKIERNSDGFLRKNDNAGIKLHYLREATHDIKEAEHKEEMAVEVTHTVDTTHLTVHGTTAAAQSSRLNKHRKSLPDKPPIKILHWDLPGMSSEAHHLKVSFYLQLRILHTSHHIADHLHETDPLTAAATLQESFDLVRRMRALEHVPGISADASRINPYGEFDDAGKDDFVRRIREVVRKTERVKESKKNWLTSILPGLSGEKDGVKGAKGESGLDDIDPEFKPAYKSLEEMNKQVQEEEPFSVKAFSYNVKLFSKQLQPLIFFISLVNKVRNWDNPLVTAMIVAELLNMCYRDYLVYLPAILILVNIVVLVLFKYDPDFVQNYLDDETRREAEAKALEDSSTNSAPVIISTINTSSTPAPSLDVTPGQPVASAVTVVRPKAEKKKEEPTGLLAKLKEYRDVAVKTKDHLTSVQHGLHDMNMRTLRVEGLYKWVRFDTTAKFLGGMVALFLLMVLVPFRFLFPFILLDWVTNKWQKEGSAVDRLLAEVPLPEKLPVLD